MVEWYDIKRDKQQWHDPRERWCDTEEGKRR